VISAPDRAITHRFLEFVSEVVGFLPISRTLRVLLVCPVHPDARAGSEFAAVFFATGVEGVAIALWATDPPPGSTSLKTLLRALEDSPKKVREVTAPEKIRSALMALYAVLEARLEDKPTPGLVLTSRFAGAAFDLAAIAAASASMPLTGNSSLADYLAMVPAGRKRVG
jgi:hypothetical protein